MAAGFSPREQAEDLARSKFTFTPVAGLLDSSQLTMLEDLEAWHIDSRYFDDDLEPKMATLEQEANRLVSETTGIVVYDAAKGRLLI